jgi:hypothetical protein
MPGLNEPFADRSGLLRKAFWCPWPESNGCIKLLKNIPCLFDGIRGYSRTYHTDFRSILATARSLIGALQQQILNNTAAHSSA